MIESTLSDSPPKTIFVVLIGNLVASVFQLALYLGIL
jgi:hypothetical protein